MTLYAWSGATYGGNVAADWDSTTGALASHAVSEGTKTVRVSVPLAADTQYVRFFAVSDRDASLVWTSPTLPVAGIPDKGGITILVR